MLVRVVWGLVFLVTVITGETVMDGLSPPVRAEEEVEGIDAPPFTDREVGRAAMAALQAYRQSMIETFTALDAVVNQPPEVPIEAQEAFSTALAAPEQALAELREAIEKHAGSKGAPKPVVAWLKDQEHAWRYTGRLGGLAVFYVAAANDTIRIWEKNWLPKLREKKKVFRGLADAINEHYQDAFLRQSLRSDDKAFVNELESYRDRAIRTAKTLQESLVDLRKRLVAAVREADPEKGLGKWSLDLSVELIGPKEPIPSEKIWIQHLVTWREVLIHRKVALDAAYAKVVEASASIRKETLFRASEKPMKTIKPYKQIVSELKDLFDDLIATRDDARDRLKNLRRKTDRERERYMELVRAYGPSVEREWKIRVARASDILGQREAKLRAARAAGPARYKQLWRKMVEDVDVAFDEMKRRETPEFKREWARVEEEATEQLEEDLAEIQREVDDAQANYDAWKEEKAEAEAEMQRMQEEHEERWKDAGLGAPRFP